MRKLSRERQRIAVLAAVLASTSGTMPVLLRGNSHAFWVWAGAEVAVACIMIALVVRLRMKGDCA